MDQSAILHFDIHWSWSSNFFVDALFSFSLESRFVVDNSLFSDLIGTIILISVLSSGSYFQHSIQLTRLDVIYTVNKSINNSASQYFIFTFVKRNEFTTVFVFSIGISLLPLKVSSIISNHFFSFHRNCMSDRVLCHVV